MKGVTALFFLNLLFCSQVLAQEAPVRTDFTGYGLELPEINFVGVIYPNQRFLLSFATSGIVSEVLVEEGDFVNQDDVLVVLDQSIEALELERLNALVEDKRLLDSTRHRLDLQRQQVQSVRGLYESTGSVSLDELNNLRMGLSALEGEIATLEVEHIRAQFDLEIAQTRLEKRSLKSPDAGYVTNILPKKGEWAQFGEPVIELVDTATSYIRIQVDDQKAAHLAEDKAVQFIVEGKSFDGKISFISPVADPASGLVEVKVWFDNPDNRLRPGLKADVKL